MVACVPAAGLFAAGFGTAPTDVGGAGPAGSCFAAMTYRSQDFGFSIQLPSGFTKVGPARGTEDAAAPPRDLLFVDPKGTQIDGKTVDTLEVIVCEMNAAPADPDFAERRMDFEAMVVAIVGEVPGLRVAERPTWTTVDGRPAVTKTHTCKVSGQDAATSAQLVFRDARAYLVRALAARAVWQTTGRELVSCVAIFAFL